MRAGISMQWDFTYDGDGTRVKQIVSTYDQTTQSITGIAITACFTLLRGALGGAYEVTTDANNVVLSTKKYYSIAGMTVAMNDGSGLQYLLTDHLGSVVAVTDANGTLTSQQRYLPFGGVRTDLNGPRVTQTDFNYTGQRAMDGLGLLDYHARFYDAVIGRFISPDPIMTGNRYSYGLNNPIDLIDPSGLIACHGTNWEDGPQCASTAEFKQKATSELRKAIPDKFKWNLVGNFSLSYLSSIYQIGMDIERYTDKLTGGNGLAWMNKNMGHINITFNFTCVTKITCTNNGGPFENPAGIFLQGGLDKQEGWIRYGLAHELAEMWDWNSGHLCKGGYCGGVADRMNLAFGGNAINDPSFYRNGHGLAGVRRANQWPDPNAYGNTGTQDYFADAFSASMEPDAGPNATNKMPGGVQDYLNAEIQHYAP